MRIGKACVLLALLACGLLSRSARAQTAALDFDAATAESRGFLLPPADVRGNFLLRTRLLSSYTREPLVVVDDRQRDDVVIREQLWGTAAASLALKHRFLIGLEIPVLIMQSTTESAFASAERPETSAALGDVKLSLRAKLLGPAGQGIHLSAGLALWAPTGSEGAYASDGTVRAKPVAIIGGFGDRMAWSSEIGVLFRESQRIPSVLPLRVSNAMLVALGGSYWIDPKRSVRVTFETRLTSAFADGAKLLDVRSSGLELLVGSVWRVFGSPLELGVALGPGLGQAPGSADYRALASVAWVPEEPPPPPDRDADGVPDLTDICLELPGLPSSDPLMDGCPEVPPDTDGDSIPNSYDACPTEPGEATGERRSHGCPKRLPAKVPEAEQPAPRAELVAAAIVISEQVQFEVGTAELKLESFKVLAEVLLVLKAHPEIELLEIEGHTDETGTLEYNQKLSEERARSVLDWLVTNGIDANRLVARGYGATVPLADNQSDAGRSQNRRVSFTVRKTRSPSTGEAEP